MNAIDLGQNKSSNDLQLAKKFHTFFLDPGDVIYMPPEVYHQVRSEKQTLAYSMFIDTE